MHHAHKAKCAHNSRRCADFGQPLFAPQGPPRLVGQSVRALLTLRSDPLLQMPHLSSRQVRFHCGWPRQSKDRSLTSEDETVIKRETSFQLQLSFVLYQRAMVCKPSPSPLTQGLLL